LDHLTTIAVKGTGTDIIAGTTNSEPPALFQSIKSYPSVLMKSDKKSGRRRMKVCRCFNALLLKIIPKEYIIKQINRE
jgi:hypothetical protein